MRNSLYFLDLFNRGFHISISLDTVLKSWRRKGVFVVDLRGGRVSVVVDLDFSSDSQLLVCYR